MLRRLFFVFILLFWMAMNFLLWRQEVVGIQLGGSAIDPEIVLQKILEAPDDSSLEVRHHQERIGFLRWKPTVEEAFDPASNNTQVIAPEGIVNRTLGYYVNIDSRLRIPEWKQQFRLFSRLSLHADRSWRDFNINFGYAASHMAINASEDSPILTVEIDDGENQRNLQIPLRDMTSTLALLSGMSPGAGSFLADLNQRLPTGDFEKTTFQWEASSGIMDVGHANLRVYRLRTNLPGGLPVKITVSRVGEILLVELPDQIRMINEVLNY